MYRASILIYICGHKALVDNRPSNDTHLYKLTTEDGNTKYYVNKDVFTYSEEQRRAVQRVIQSSNKSKVVLGIDIVIRDGSILKEDDYGYREQVDNCNSHLKSLNNYSVVVTLYKQVIYSF